MRIPDYKPSFTEKVVAQWPGALGLLLLCLGMLIVWQIGGYLGSRLGIGLMALGIASMGYWALANRNDGYNF